MSNPDSSPLTLFLQEFAAGGERAQEKVLPLVYAQLHELAQRLFVREPQGHTLQPTVIVHDAWQKLLAQDRTLWKNRAQFFAVAATVMRRILVDHARARLREKRGGGAERVSIIAEALAAPEQGADILELDSVLHRLRELDPRQHNIVELRFFSGLSVKEVAECLGVSVRTVEADWTMAKAWLRRELERERSS